MSLSHSRSFRLKRKESSPEMDSLDSNKSAKKRPNTLAKLFKRRSMSMSKPESKESLHSLTDSTTNSGNSSQSKHKLSIDIPGLTNGRAFNISSSRVPKSKSVPNNLTLYHNKNNRTITINGDQLDLSKMPKLPPVQSIKPSKSKMEELNAVRRKLIGNNGSSSHLSFRRNSNSKENDEYYSDSGGNDEDEGGDEGEDEKEEFDVDEINDAKSATYHLLLDGKDVRTNKNEKGHNHSFANYQHPHLSLSRKSRSALRLRSSTPNHSDDEIGKPANATTTVTGNTGLFSTLMNTFNLKSFADITKDQDDINSLDTDSFQSSLSNESDHNSGLANSNKTLSSTVNFVPVKKALITTLGKGSLTLDSFPNNQTQLLNDDKNKVLVDNNGSLKKTQEHSYLQPFHDKSVSSADNLLNKSNSSDLDKKSNSVPREARTKSSLSPMPRKSTIRNSLTSIVSSNDEFDAANGTNFGVLVSPTAMSHSLSIKKKLKLPLTNKKQFTDINLSRTASNDDFNNNNNNSNNANNNKDLLFEKIDLKPPSEKRQESFHSLFSNLPNDELLIEDFTCAFKKEILVQGKLYLTEHHLCFHSNIIGLITHLTIPLNAILKVQKKKTVGIPNSIEFSNLHNKYVFATFLSRDSAYSLIYKIWKLNINNEGYGSIYLDIDDDEIDSLESVSTHSSELEDDEDDNKKGDATINNNTAANSKITADNDTSDTSISDQENMVKDDDSGDKNDDTALPKEDNVFNGLAFEGPKTHAETSNGYTADSSDVKIIDANINAPMGLIYNLLFGDDISFMQNLLKVQKNFDIGDIPKFSDNKRVYQYIKPVNGGPVGPKQTKCIVEEVVDTKDFNKSCLVVQLTESPDVPSGNSFKVKTKVFLSWAANNSTRLFIVTNIVWSGKSWIKGAIEKGTISGQKEALGILVSEVKKKISAGGTSTVGKPKKKDRKKPKEEVVEEASDHEAEVEAESEPEVPKSYMDIFIEQFDLKFILIIILFIFMICDKFKSSKAPQGYELYSSDRMLMSESSLWEWIKEREHGHVSHMNIASIELNKKQKIRPSKESLKNTAKRKMSQQELQDTIDMMTQELSALKERANDSESLL